MLLYFSVPAFSQNKLKISGTVSDSTKPLAFVTVRIFKINLKAPLQTTLSAEDGKFQLNKPDTGNYILTFTHTGFAEQQVKITVVDNSMVIDPVKLSKATGMLKEVVVTSQRPMVEQQDDKVILNVEDDPANRTETAIDILRKTPFVSVDGEDNIKINGKSNFRVLLNGRETSMFARNVREALRGFPGSIISKIEVITSPSAKYDGEGVGGLINIITKKKVAGYNGTLSSFTRTSDRLQTFSVSTNAKFGDFGLSGYFNKGFREPVRQGNYSTTIPTVKDFYARRTLDGDDYASSGWSYGNAELSWEMDSLNTLSVYTNIDSYNSKNESDQTIVTDFIGSPSTTSYYSLYNKSNNPGVNVGSDYIKHFKNNKEREFSLRFLGEFSKNDAELNSEQDNPGTDRYLLNKSNAINNQYTIQADNIIPITKTAKLEGGLKAILRKASSDFRSQVKYGEGETYKTNIANTDYFRYNQDVISLYSTYSWRMKKSNFRFGVRIEYTNVNGDFVTSKTQVKNDYTTVLPNLQWTNRLSKITTLALSYTKRLQRPYIYDLNPFEFNNDSLNVTSGNPDLAPQTVHVVGAQVRFSNGNTFAGINVEGSYSDNKILQYASFNPQTGITKTTSLNIGREFQASLNLNISTKFNPDWTMNINGSLRYSTVRNNADHTQSNSGVGCNIGMSSNYKFSNKFSISTFLGFWQEPQTIQVTYPFNIWHNFAFNYKIFKEKVQLSLRGVNVYEKDRGFKTITKDRNFYSESISTQFRRAVVLAVVWNFGKLSENVSKKKGVNNDDMITRPAAQTGN